MTENTELKNTVLERVFGDEALMEVDVSISVVLGKSLLRVYQLLKLGRGAVIELNQHLSDTVEILANDVPIAQGEVVVTDEGFIGVKIIELLASHRSEETRLIKK